MKELLSIGILPVVLTLSAYQVGVQIQKKSRLSLCNPILIAVLVVLAVLSLTGMERASYQEGMQLLSWLMTPATVCLAIPMYEQIQILRKNLKGILVGIAAGTAGCLTMLLGSMLLLRFDRTLMISLLPKGITTAIGMPLAELYGGIPSIATLGIIFTGIFGNVLGHLFCKWFGITHEIAKGVAFGTGAHVIGTAKASEISPLAGAVSSLSLVVAGLMTAALFPVMIHFL